jgi:6-pyruvoyltetrahydropterin/6-carboxytetrahydropterin synthase
MSFRLTTTRSFSASHQLRLYDGTLESLHGHNWIVKVTIGSAGLDAIGVVMDFHDLSARVEAILSTAHNRHLNQLPAFETTNPSAENVAVWVARELALPQGVKLLSVEVWETPDNSAVYLPD